MPPKVEGIIETSLYVSNLERSVAFYRELFGFEVMQGEGNRMRSFIVSSRQILLLFRTGGSTEGEMTPNGQIPPHDGRGTLHLAFAVNEVQLTKWREWLDARGVSIESEVQYGGRSVYFRDPDGHLLELSTPGCWPIY